MSFISLIGPRPASDACERFEPEAQATVFGNNRHIQRGDLPFDVVLGSLEASTASFPSRVSQNPDCGFVAMGVQYVMRGHNSEPSQYVGPRILHHGKGGAMLTPIPEATHGLKKESREKKKEAHVVQKAAKAAEASGHPKDAQKLEEIAKEMKKEAHKLDRTVKKIEKLKHHC